MSIKLLGRALDGTTVTLLEPTSMIITRAYDTPAEMLEITFPCTAEIPDLTNIQVNHNSEMIFGGYCDEIIRSMDSDGSFVTINARSPGCLLIDNEAEPASYTNLTATAYFNAKLQPLGFTQLTLPNSTKTAATFQVNKGHTLWDVFTQLCFRLYGREPYITSSLGIAVGALSTDNYLYISNDPTKTAQRFCSMQFITRRSSALSSIHYRGSDGSYSSTMTNPFENNMSVKRERYVIPGVEFADVPSLDAYQRIIHGELGIHSVHVTLPGLYNLYPGKAIGIQSTLGGTRLMAVYQSKIIYNYTGCRTRLILGESEYM